MLYRDELAGWIGSFDRYSRGSAERGFWIETYGGRPYVIDRKQQKGEPISIPYLPVAVLGGIQPDRLGNLLLEGEDDGLSARLLYSWPDPIPPSPPRGSRDDSMAPASLADCSLYLCRKRSTGRSCSA
jgi:putative DNA primase/helicase